MATHLDNETELLAEAREGNADAFGRLANQYYGNIYRLVLRVTGNKEDAEDVLQDAFLKAYTSLSQFRGNSRFYTWLVRIALNQALMKLRKRRIEKEVSLSNLVGTDNENPVHREVEDCEQSPEKLYAEVELQEHFREALDGLRPCLRTAFVMRNVEEYSSGEMAEMLGLSVMTVKSRLLRARLKLRQRLGKIFGPARVTPRASTTHSSNSGREVAGPRKRRIVLQPQTADVS